MKCKYFHTMSNRSTPSTKSSRKQKMRSIFCLRFNSRSRGKRSFSCDSNCKINQTSRGKLTTPYNLLAKKSYPKCSRDVFNWQRSLKKTMRAPTSKVQLQSSATAHHYQALTIMIAIAKHWIKSSADKIRSTTLTWNCCTRIVNSVCKTFCKLKYHYP